MGVGDETGVFAALLVAESGAKFCVVFDAGADVGAAFVALVVGAEVGAALVAASRLSSDINWSSIISWEKCELVRTKSLSFAAYRDPRL